MRDVTYVAIVVGFFGLCVAYVSACAWIVGVALLFPGRMRATRLVGTLQHPSVVGERPVRLLPRDPACGGPLAGDS